MPCSHIKEIRPATVRHLTSSKYRSHNASKWLHMHMPLITAACAQSNSRSYINWPTHRIWSKQWYLTQGQNIASWQNIAEQKHQPDLLSSVQWFVIYYSIHSKHSNAVILNRATALFSYTCSFASDHLQYPSEKRMFMVSSQRFSRCTQTALQVLLKSRAEESRYGQVPKKEGPGILDLDHGS